MPIFPGGFFVVGRDIRKEWRHPEESGKGERSRMAAGEGSTGVGDRASCLNFTDQASINTGIAYDACDVVPGEKPNAGPHTLQQWWNILAFSQPTDREVFGNAGRSPLRGRGFVTFGFGAMKTTNLTENLRLQSRFEAFNLFNHPVLSMPANYLDDYHSFDASRQVIPTPLPNSALGSAYGSIGSTAVDNRQLQFALKLIW